MATFKPAQLDNFALSGAGATIGATSIVLQSFLTIDGEELSMSNFGSVGYGTLDPGNGALEEQISFTGVTQNSNGTATLTGVKTVLFISPYTETSGLAKTHAGATPFVISNTAGFYNQYPTKVGDETISGQWTFTNTPIVPGTVSNASTSVKGVSKLSIAAVDADNPIVAGTNDPRIPVAYAVDSVGTDAYAITPDPAITAYAAGQVFTFKAATANTGTATLNVSGLGAKTIKKNATATLVTGDIPANAICVCVYDGTDMQLVSPAASYTVPVSRTYTSSDTWTKPTGLKYVVVELVGGGGNGGTSGTSGGAGGTATGGDVNITGAGGGNGNGGTGNGGTGGDSWFSRRSMASTSTTAGQGSSAAVGYGGGGSGTSGANPAAGGGAGGYSKKTIAAASLGATETVTVGAAAGASSFGSHCSANGGSNGGNGSGTGNGAGLPGVVFVTEYYD